MKMPNAKILLFLGFLILTLCHQSLTKKVIKKEIPSCKVTKDFICILNNSQKLREKEQCKDSKGNIYQGVGITKRIQGKCVLIKTSGLIENSIKNKIIEKRQEEEDDDEDEDEENENLNEIIDTCDFASTNAKNCKIGYYLKDDDGKPVSILNKQGILYNCSTETTCSKVNESEVKTGYYKNVDIKQVSSYPYIQCQKGSNSCVLANVVATTTDDCTIAVEGGIIAMKNNINQITYKLCLNSLQIGNAVPLSNPGKYFVSVNRANVFGQSENNYVLVNIYENGNALKDESNTSKYQYSNNNLTFKSKSERTDVCGDGKLPTEFTLIDSENYYYSKNN